MIIQMNENDIYEEIEIEGEIEEPLSTYWLRRRNEQRSLEDILWSDAC